jgi:hypothetical protein
MDQADFPWRTLGKLLVDDELLSASDLDRALAEQRRTGKLLGQILVQQGSMTGVELTRALARQHGVFLEAADGAEEEAEPEPEEPLARWERPWRPLGAVLVDDGFVAELDLQDALAEKHAHQDRRLGEILVRRGHLSHAQLAIALAEQHGVILESPLGRSTRRTATYNVPTYCVVAVGYEAEGALRDPLFEGPNLLEAADFACEYVDREEPQALEIERRDGDSVETVWTYSRDRAAAEAAASKRLVETFGFDPTLWGSS